MENNTDNLITDIIEEKGNNINSLVGEQVQTFATSTQFKLVNSDNLSKFASLFNNKIKADVDAKLASYVTNSALNSKNYATKSEVNTAASNAESNAIASAQGYTDSKLKDYVTNTALTNKGYATESYADSAASTAETNATSAAKSYTDTQLKSYVTTTALNNKGYATKTEMQEGDAATLTSSKSYTNTQLTNYVTTTALNNKGYATESYADSAASAAQTNATNAAKTYTDTEVGKAKTYAEGQAATAQANAKSYTDTEVGKAKSYTDDEIETYAETVTADITAAKNAAIGAAKTETTNQVNAAKKELNTAISTGDSATLASANAYTDTEIGKAKEYTDDALDTAKEYADDQASAAQSAAQTFTTNQLKNYVTTTTLNGKGYATTTYVDGKAASAETNAKNYTDTAKTALDKTITDGDAATLSSAKSYTDSSISTAKTALNKTITDGDSATLTSANSYTDTKLSSHTTTMDNKITKAQSAATDAAKSYTDTALANLVDSAPEAMDTLGELATAIKNNKDTFDGYVAGIANEYLKLSGGTMSGSINFTSTSHGIKNSGNMILKNDGKSTVLSSVNNTMYFRPKGDSDTTVQVSIDTSGKVTAPKFSGIFEGNASSADSAGKVGNNLKIQLNGGTAEGTSQFTFNGSAAKTVNITPAGIGAAKADHGDHVTYSTSAPKANGTASAGSASNVARGDHVHPAQTSVSGNAGSANKVNNALTVQYNGTTQATFDGSAAKTINITPGGIGAATSGHNHDSAYLKLSGGTMTGNIAFTDVTSTTYPATGGKLSWNGSTDGADIYYQVNAADKGRLVFNTRDDADCIFAFANKGTVHTTIDNSGNFSGKAATAGTADKVKSTLTVQYNGTKQVDFNGSAAKIINITPAGIGAATSGHVHITDSEVTTALTNAFGSSYIPS